MLRFGLGSAAAASPSAPQAKRQIKVRSAADLASCIGDAMAGWSRWALGVHWLVLAAEAVGLRGQGEQAEWQVVAVMLGEGLTRGLGLWRGLLC